MTLTQFSRLPHYKDCKNEPCLHCISCTNRWILTRSHQHFECKILTKKRLSAPYLLNLMMDSGLVLLVKRNTLILYSYFHRTFMFLLLVSVTFYRCIEKRHSKSFLPHFSTCVEILLKSCRKITAGIHL